MKFHCENEENEEICEIAATDEEADSEPALKQIPNLTNPKNFPNQLGKSGTKPTLPLPKLLPVLPTDVFKLATENL